LFRSSWEAHLEPQRRHHFICVSILPLWTMRRWRKKIL
jgi:hypothetical protein